MENTPNLWSMNDPARFWQVIGKVDERAWQYAVDRSIRLDGYHLEPCDLDQFLYFTLGEGRFGENHWKLSTFNRFYWWLKPGLPTPVIRLFRACFSRMQRASIRKHWPIDDRLPLFQWEVMRRYLQATGFEAVEIKDFWPEKRDFGLVLTHDVENEKRHAFIPVVADLEEKYGFRSLFNIVGDQVTRDKTLFNEIKARGFEIGLHGYHHDERLYRSENNFRESIGQLNNSLKDLEAVGYRSPLNLRNPAWMQSLEIEYDLSFFDTDLFEPIPGGAMNIWPFRIGRFLELPATLVQDNTLVNLLGESTPRLWLEKVDFIKRFHGMALLNSHPDYLTNQSVWKVYEKFLARMSERRDLWNALPRNVARWWQERTESMPPAGQDGINSIRVSLENGELVFAR